MAEKRLTQRGVERMRKREAATGLDPDDEAARWLAEHDPPPKPEPAKSAFKSKTLHRWKKSR